VFTGTVSKLSRDFGFLRDGAGRTRFFHRTAVAGTGFESLREGQTVQFEPQDLPKGLRALNVRVVPGGAGARPGAGRGDQPAVRGAPPARPASYGRPTPTGAAGRGGTQYGQRRTGGATGGARRSADGGSASTNSGWRSSLSPFRGDPPSAPPRRRPR
jgi:CspA family cold shock protein